MRTTQAYNFDKNLQCNFEILARHKNNMSVQEKEIFEGIDSFARKTGKVTYRQLKTIGSLSIRYCGRRMSYFSVRNMQLNKRRWHESRAIRKSV
jgi:hypothetical protein